MQKVITGLVLVSILLLGGAPRSYAVTASELQKKLQETQKRQAEIERQRKQKEADAAAVAALLKKIDGNISATERALKSTTTQLDEVTVHIEQTTTALHQSEEKLAQLKAQLEELLAEQYQIDAAQSPILDMLSGKTLKENVEVAEYRSSLDAEFDRLAKDEEASRTAIAEAKARLEEEQARLDQLKDQQAATKQGLESEQKRKNKVLADTNNAISTLKKEEAALAARERDVEAQIQALLRARRGGKVPGGINIPVKKGQVIGYEDTTGNSTGPHVHFSVFKDCDLSQSVNPYNFLGSLFIWPLSDYIVTQGYGMTDFARAGAYRGSGHNGVDIHQYRGAPVMAANDGVKILDQYFGAYGNAVVIEHSNGYCSLYGHMR